MHACVRHRALAQSAVRWAREAAVRPPIRLEPAVQRPGLRLTAHACLHQFGSEGTCPLPQRCRAARGRAWRHSHMSARRRHDHDARADWVTPLREDRRTHPRALAQTRDSPRMLRRGRDRRPRELNELSGATGRSEQNVTGYPDVRSEKQREHGAAFPLSLARQQVEIYAGGRVVLDPFAGVGTTLDACTTSAARDRCDSTRDLLSSPARFGRPRG